MKLLTATLLSLNLVGLPALAADPTISSAEVQVDMTAVSDPDAAQYWGHLDKDLEAAILQLMNGRIEEDAPKLEITIDGVRLAEAYEAPDGVSNATLTGHVLEASDSGLSETKAYDLSVDLKSAVVLLPEGTDVSVLTWDTPQLYSAIVATFAQRVVANLK